MRRSLDRRRRQRRRIAIFVTCLMALVGSVATFGAVMAIGTAPQIAQIVR